MDFWLIVVIAFGAAVVLGFGVVLWRARADAAGGTPATTLTASSPSAAPAPPSAPSPATVTPEAMAHVQQLVAQGRKIQAIKVLREHTGLGLKQAKDTVERMDDSGVVAALDVPEPAAPPSDDVMARVRALAAQGKKIHAIKELRAHRPELGLKEAKDLVERL